MDLVREGATSAALDEGQPRHLRRTSPNRGHGEIGVRVTGVERPGPVGRYQDPGDGLQRRVLAIHALLTQLPHRAVHSGVRNPPGHVEVRGPHSFGTPGSGCVRTQSQKEAPSQQPGSSATSAEAVDLGPHSALSAGDPDPGLGANPVGSLRPAAGSAASEVACCRRARSGGGRATADPAPSLKALEMLARDCRASVGLWDASAKLRPAGWG